MESVDYVGEAVRLIDPTPDHRERCTARVREIVARLHELEPLRREPSAVVRAKAFGQLAKGLAEARSAIEDIAGSEMLGRAFHGHPGGAVDRQLFLQDLERIRFMAEIFSGISGPPGGPRTDPLMETAAFLALALLKEHSDRGPRLEVHYELAGLLFEAVTGEHANPERACKLARRSVRTNAARAPPVRP